MNHSFYRYFFLFPLFTSLSVSAQNAQDSVKTTVNIDGVTIVGHRPLIKSDAGIDEINVRGSILGKMGSLMKMFSITPGIEVMGKQLIVSGAGVPIIFIDGREVTQQKALETLQAANVSKVIIDRNPGSEYPNGTKAVIKIYTYKPLSDFIALTLQNDFTVRRRPFDSPTLDFEAKIGRWTTSVIYAYSFFQNLNKETYFTEIRRPAGTFRTDEYNHDLMRSIDHNVIWTNDFMLNPNSRLSFVYDFDWTRDKDFGDETMTVRDLDNHKSEKELNIYSFSYTPVHNFTLQYYGSWDNNKELNLTADYTVKHDRLTNWTHERSVLKEDEINTFTKSRYNILTLNGTYSFPLPWKMKGKATARYYYVDNPSDYITDNRFMDAALRQRQTTARDQLGAGALEIRKSWKRFSTRLGLRYEYTDTRLWLPKDGERTRVGRTSSDLLPSVLLTYYPLKGLTMAASYQRSVGRQGYRGLDESPIYKDSLQYSVGNSSLTPSHTDIWKLETYWSHFNLILNYTRSNGAIWNQQYAPFENSNVIYDVPMNFGVDNFYSIRLKWGQTFGKWYLYASPGVWYETAEYPYMGEVVKLHKWAGSGTLFSRFSLNDHIQMAMNWTLYTRSTNLNVVSKPKNNLQFVVSGSWLNDRLNATLSFTDILHKYNLNNMSQQYLNTTSGTYGTNDMRGICLSVSFKLFNQDISTQGSSDNSAPLQRTNNR